MANFIVEDIKRIAKGDNPLTKIILLNVVAFIATNIISQFYPIELWLGVPGSFTEFVFVPWSLVSYLFVHANLSHIFFNMLILYVMGNILRSFLSNRQFLGIYFLGGIFSALMYMVLATIGIIPINSYVIGASAAVTAVLVAAATLAPDYPVRYFVFGPFKLKYVALVLVILSSVLDLSLNTGGKLSHLAGALFGYFFVKQLRSGTDWSIPLFKIIDPVTNLFSKKPKMRVVSNKQNGKRPQTRTQQEPGLNHQARINAILDKISASGYDALSAEEKEYLFRARNK